LLSCLLHLSLGLLFLLGFLHPIAFDV
jgi:hypothetical protein